MANESPAYFISGHGGEKEGEFNVPNGCCVVVKKEICELASVDSFHVDFDNLLNMDMDDILNPTTPTSQIKLRCAFGNPPTFFTQRKQCPQYRYRLCNVHVYETEGYILVDSYVGSGLIDIRAVKQNRQNAINRYGRLPIIDKFIKVDSTDKSTKDDAIKKILEMYKFSVYPLQETVKKYLEDKWQHDTDVTLYKMLKDLHETNDSTFSVTEEELCRKKPGIHYHNVCRMLSSKLQPYGNEFKRLRDGNSSDRAHPSQRNMIHNPICQSLLKESLGRRCTEKVYQNSNYAKTKLYTSAENNCIELQGRVAAIETEKKKIRNGTYSHTDQKMILHIIDKEMKTPALIRALHDAEKRRQQYKPITTRNGISVNPNSNRSGSPRRFHPGNGRTRNRNIKGGGNTRRNKNRIHRVKNKTRRKSG